MTNQKENTPWAEPPHESPVKLYNFLRDIYGVIRQKYQKDIDGAFDRASQQIGFVVTTSLPVVLEVGEKGVLGKAALVGKNFAGTVFEKELSPILQKLSAEKLHLDIPGEYSLLVFWFDALRLKLQTERMNPAYKRKPWQEPAHSLRRPDDRAISRGLINFAWSPWSWVPYVQEPVHWLSPGIALDPTEVVIIAAIDEVYPDLKLGEIISQAKSAPAM